MTSSHRESLSCDAVLWRDDEAVGPMRLPKTGSAHFVDEFNLTYHCAGLSIQVLDENVERSEEEDVARETLQDGGAKSVNENVSRNQPS